MSDPIDYMDIYHRYKEYQMEVEAAQKRCAKCGDFPRGESFVFVDFVGGGGQWECWPCHKEDGAA